MSLMNADEAFTGPVNLGNSVESAICDLAATIGDLTDSGSFLDFRHLQMDDATLANEALEGRATAELHSDLQRSLACFEIVLASQGLAVLAR